ncbi:SRP40-like protein [Scheffersomyces stipitis CBS 6054]|uniref:Hap4 transcription factor heteromerisation domain-containing protein n=1 Tax=Scheffersomyces stipitis (strain ATCC 58785 / CBS 6054 / NBRC 10063 / NRRL Y-11545) TaxID=322104 RepID=A3GF72_PICST|nr:hypothetical protein similar to SRP40 [Scheffersomyces stipitis CBS 6054]EAZ63301.2 SRP40-like protein [Scheffersomyces stipitis CBS 6054]
MYTNPQSNSGPSAASAQISTTNAPIVVRTSKQWVLPPRPKPGRKPVSLPKADGPVERKKKYVKKSCTSELSTSSASSSEMSASSPSASSSIRKQSLQSSTVKLPQSTSTRSAVPIHTQASQTSQTYSHSNSQGSQSRSPSELHGNNLNNNSNGITTTPSHSASKFTPMPAKATAPTPAMIISSLSKNVRVIDAENLSLKSHLLSLIHDYKHLKEMVLNNEGPIEEPDDLDKNVHKRSFNELVTHQQLEDDFELDHEPSDLSTAQTTPSATPAAKTSEIDDFETFIKFDAITTTASSAKNPVTMKKKKTHRKFNHYKDFEKLDTVEDSDMDIDFEDDDDEEIDSPSSSGLSRTTSPSSDFESNSLMSTLTRSTTVSSVNTTSFPLLDKKASHPFKIGRSSFFELPKYDEEDSAEYSFKFDESMNTSSLKSNQDQYNMINDFLEEKILNNDLKYYVENDNGEMRW